MLEYESICRPTKKISVYTELVNTASFKGNSIANSHQRSDGKTIEDYLVKACNIFSKTLTDNNDNQYLDYMDFKDIRYGYIEKKIEIKQKGFEVYRQYTIELARYLLEQYGIFDEGGDDIEPKQSVYTSDKSVAPDLILERAIIEVKTSFGAKNKPTGPVFFQCLEQFLTFTGKPNGVLVFINATHRNPFHTTIYEFNEARAREVFECILYAKVYNAIIKGNKFEVKKPGGLKRKKDLPTLKTIFEKKKEKIKKKIINIQVNTRLEIPFRNWWMKIRKEFDKFEEFFKKDDEVMVKYPDKSYPGIVQDVTRSFVKILFPKTNTYTTIEKNNYYLVKHLRDSLNYI